MSRPPPKTYGRSGQRRSSSDAPLAALAPYTQSSSPSPHHPSSQDLGGYGEGTPEGDDAPKADTSAEVKTEEDDEPVARPATEPTPDIAEETAAEPVSNAPRIVFTVNPEFKNVTPKDTFGAREADYPFSAGLPAECGPHFDDSDPRWTNPTISLDRKSYVTGKFTGRDGDTYHLPKGMDKRANGAEPPTVHLVPPAYAHPAMHPNVLANCAPFLTPVNDFPVNSNIYPAFETTRGIRLKSGISRPAYDANHKTHKDDAMPFWAECAFPCHQCDNDRYPDSPMRPPHYCGVATFPLQNEPDVPSNARRIKCQACVTSSRPCLFTFDDPDGKRITVELYVLFFEDKEAHPTKLLDRFWWFGKDGKGNDKKSVKKPAAKRSRLSGAAAASSMKKKMKVKIEKPEVDREEGEEAEGSDFEMKVDTPSHETDSDEVAAEAGSSVAGPSGLRSASSPRASSVGDGDEGSMVNWKDYIGSRSESDIVEPDVPLKDDDGVPTDPAPSAGLVTADGLEADGAKEPTAELATTAGNDVDLSVDEPEQPQANPTSARGETAIDLEQLIVEPQPPQQREATPTEDTQPDKHNNRHVPATATTPVSTDDTPSSGTLPALKSPSIKLVDRLTSHNASNLPLARAIDQSNAEEVARIEAQYKADLAAGDRVRCSLDEEADKVYEEAVRAAGAKRDAAKRAAAVDFDAADEAARAKFNAGVEEIHKRAVGLLAVLVKKE